MDEDTITVHDHLPEKPSRASGRAYVKLMFGLAVLEFGAAAYFGFTEYLVILAINVLPVSAMLIAKAATSLDLNKWMDSATQMYKAHRGFN